MPPDGTGKDSITGLYTKLAEDGKTTLFWEPIQYGSDVQNGITGHWVETRMLNGELIYLYNNALAGNTDQLVDSVPFNQFILQNNGQLTAAYTLSHPEQAQLKDFGPGSELFGQSFSSDLLVYLATRYYHVDPKTHLSDQQWLDFMAAMKAGTASIAVGNDQWVLSKGYTEIIVDDTIASADPTFQKTDNYHWKAMVVNGQLVVLISTSAAEKESHHDMVIMSFAPMLEVIFNDPFTNQKLSSFYGSANRAAAAEFAESGGSENITYPHVTVQPTSNFLDVNYSE